MVYAFKYLESVKGDESEEEYPYKAKVKIVHSREMITASCLFYQNGKCEYKESKAKVDDKGYKTIEKKDEDALQEAVANVGPISVAIDASHRSFQVCYYYCLLLTILIL